MGKIPRRITEPIAENCKKLQLQKIEKIMARSGWVFIFLSPVVFAWLWPALGRKSFLGISMYRCMALFCNSHGCAATGLLLNASGDCFGLHNHQPLSHNNRKHRDYYQVQGTREPKS